MFLFSISFIVNRFFLLFKICDVYINYKTETIETDCGSFTDTFKFEDLKGVKKRIYFVTLNFPKKKFILSLAGVQFLIYLNPVKILLIS